jgi:ribosomal protein S18 acetylase RimI-like enzyme
MEKNKIKVYSHTDPDVRLILEKISKYVQEAEAMKFPYWIFVQDSNPIGIVVIGKEPIHLLAPPGTRLASVNLIDAKLPKEDIGAFACEALKLAMEKNVGYALATFRFNERTAISEFEKLDFKEFDDCYRMVCQLDKTFEPSSGLQFVQVKKEEIRKFIELGEKFLEGSPDVTITEALKHLPELPDEFLTFYYSLEEFYFATKDQQMVGILNIKTSEGRISNIGVDPQQRGKGYGTQIMLFGLEQLKKSGCRQAFLRVHVKNRPAIHLYESLGFSKAERYKRIIWREQNVK